MTDSGEQSGVGRRLMRALVARDFTALAACFDAPVQFRALTPSSSRERSSGEEAADCFRDWFGKSERLELLDGAVEPFGQRHRLSWRLDGFEEGRHYVVEQQAFATVRNDRIVAMDLVCSGFQRDPLPGDAPAAPSAGEMHADAVLDGGEANCATLTPLVKAALRNLASGQVLEIVTTDPNAEGDIASWSRLTGNPLLGARDEGAHRHFYVSKK